MAMTCSELIAKLQAVVATKGDLVVTHDRSLSGVHAPVNWVDLQAINLVKNPASIDVRARGAEGQYVVLS